MSAHCESRDTVARTAQHIISNLDQSANDPLSIQHQMRRDVQDAERPSLVEDDRFLSMTPPELTREIRFSHFNSQMDLQERGAAARRQQQERPQASSQGQQRQQVNGMSQRLANMTLDVRSNPPRQGPVNGASRITSRSQQYRASHGPGNQRISHQDTDPAHASRGRGLSQPGNEDGQGPLAFPPPHLLPLLIPQLAYAHPSNMLRAHAPTMPSDHGYAMAPVFNGPHHYAADGRTPRAPRGGGLGGPHPLSQADSYPAAGNNPRQQSSSQDSTQEAPRNGDQQQGPFLNGTEQPPRNSNGPNGERQ
ncbi:MAG: hypothetical protein L6R37_004446 [Teloschistes peruensis]|nr:MAG: hypothetical protein L6R37_004446 [Teloschistes peruensis]